MHMYDQNHRRWIFPIPKAKKKVQEFFGLAGYYWRLIPYMAMIAAPLSDLNRTWYQGFCLYRCNGASSATLHHHLVSSEAVLIHPQFDCMLTLQNDKSDWWARWGAPGSQFCWKLLPRKEKYFTIEKEQYDIRLAVQASVFTFSVTSLRSRRIIQYITGMAWPTLGKYQLPD